MREPPPGVTDAEVLARVRDAWSPRATRVEHLPVGFGAHHWAAYDGAVPLLFVTFDRVAERHTAHGLEAAYAGARALRDGGLEFVLACLPSSGGTLTAHLADGVLSCTPWVDGESEGDLDVVWTTTALGRLHAADPPPGIP
ncbi:MAG: hypothetical protein WB797_13230, partial [Nocardioides sp.]